MAFPLAIILHARLAHMRNLSFSENPVYGSRTTNFYQFLLPEPRPRECLRLLRSYLELFTSAEPVPEPM